jgi:hypothetical protein
MKQERADDLRRLCSGAVAWHQAAFALQQHYGARSLSSAPARREAMRGWPLMLLVWSKAGGPTQMATDYIQG